MPNRIKHGRFMPKNPQKYVGNIHKIFWRSAWELRLMRFLDTNPSILHWSSEELWVNYVNPVTTDSAGRPKISRYFPDFVIMYRDVTGAIKTDIIEIKPMKETMRTPGMSERDKMAYAVNKSKWDAADRYAKANGATFKVLTEQALFYNPKRKK